MSRKRTAERREYIGKYIRQHYPEKGPQIVAAELGEPEPYIRKTAQSMGVKKAASPCRTKSVITRMQSKIDILERERDELRHLCQKQKESIKSLRTDLIEQLDINHKLKKRKKE